MNGVKVIPKVRGVEGNCLLDWRSDCSNSHLELLFKAMVETGPDLHTGRPKADEECGPPPPLHTYI